MKIKLMSLDSDTILQIQDQREHNTYMYLTIVKLEQIVDGAHIPPQQITLSLDEEMRDQLIALLGGKPEWAE